MDTQKDALPATPSTMGQSLPPAEDARMVDVRENKDMAALSYAWVLSVFVFLAKKESAFVQFHARQAMVLFALSVVFWFVPVFGRVLELAVLALCSFGFLSAAQGEWKELPLVGAVARGEWGVLRTQWKTLLATLTRSLKAGMGLFHRRSGASSLSAAGDGRSGVSPTAGDGRSIVSSSS